MAKLKCPMSLMANDCIKDECAWWRTVEMTQNTGEKKLEGGCSVFFAFEGQMEVARTNRGVAAELEWYRKEFKESLMAEALLDIAKLMYRAERRQLDQNGYVPQNHPSISAEK